MAKQSQIEKAIAALDADIAVLQAAKARLLQQYTKAQVRRPRVVPKDLQVITALVDGVGISDGLASSRQGRT